MQMRNILIGNGGLHAMMGENGICLLGVIDTAGINRTN